MAEVTRVKVWSKTWNGKDKETRIYIDMSDGRRGGLYLTGNPYEEAGHIDGRITQDDIKAAAEIARKDGKWRTMYEEDIEHAKWLRERAGK